MGTNNRSPNKHSQGCGHSYERARCATCGKQHGGKCLAGTDDFLHFVIRDKR